MTAYVTEQAFNNATDRSGDSPPGLGVLLEAISRHVERQLEAAKDYWHAGTAGEDRVFTARGVPPLLPRHNYLYGHALDGYVRHTGSARLYLHDGRWNYCATAITAITLDKGTAPAYRGWPDNASINDEPWIALDTQDYQPWPAGRYTITGTWGYPSTPGVLEEIVTMVADHVLRLELAGPLAQVENIDSAIQFTPGVARLIAELEEGIARRAAVLA